MTTSSQYYNKEFFNDIAPGALSTARQVVPYMLDLFECDSVVDVGCGVGAWLSVFKDFGVSEVVGIDGDYVNRSQLLIPKKSFIPADLTKSFHLSRKFDLAVSLEVAEHLSSETSDAFVKLLTSLSSVVLFSASIPFQNGINHVNEQWLEYWIDKFTKCNYRAIDCLRQRFWNNPEVDWWYAQNMVLYVSESAINTYPKLKVEAAHAAPPLSLVHPSLLMHKQNRLMQLPRLHSAWKSLLKRTYIAIINQIRF